MPRQARPSKCGACDRPQESPLFCGNCQTLHSAEGRTFFELLGFDPVFDLDAAELRSAYLRCSRDTHPDRFGRHPDAAQQSERISATLNQAYQVLSDPLRRAEYLLELMGGPSAQQDKRVPQNVLNMSIMLREEIDEALSSGATTAVAGIRSQIQQRYDAVRAQIANLARGLPGDEELRSKLRLELNTVKYFQRLLEQA